MKEECSGCLEITIFHVNLFMKEALIILFGQINESHQFGDSFYLSAEGTCDEEVLQQGEPLLYPRSMPLTISMYFLRVFLEMLWRLIRVTCLTVLLQPAADFVSELEAKDTSEDMIRDIRSILTGYGISSNEDIEKVNNRFKECVRLENDFNERLNILNKQYVILKEVEYQVRIARSRYYCYGYECNERMRQVCKDT